VVVTGFATDFDDDTTLDFGEGIEASVLSVASPTSLLVHLEVAEDAALGPMSATIDGLGYGGLVVEDPDARRRRGRLRRGARRVAAVGRGVPARRGDPRSRSP
jgi:hypothetical protein